MVSLKLYTLTGQLSELLDLKVDDGLPQTGVMRHADAGYPVAIETAAERGIDLPMIDR